MIEPYNLQQLIFFHLNQTKYVNDLISKFVQAKGRHSVTKDIPMSSRMASKLRVAQTDTERAKVKQTMRTC